jgi:hypothetical protein
MNMIALTGIRHLLLSISDDPVCSQSSSLANILPYSLAKKFDSY